MKHRSLTAALLALTLTGAACAQNIDNLVFRVVPAGGTPADNTPASALIIHTSADATSIVSVGGIPSGYYIVSDTIPWTRLTTLDGTNIHAVNASGQVCGSVDIDGTRHPFIASPTSDTTYSQIQLLSMHPYSELSYEAMDIADDGTVLGSVNDEGGRVLVWAPNTTVPTVMTAPGKGEVPILGQSISSDGSRISGILRINDQFSESHLFTATTPHDAEIVPDAFHAGHYWITKQHIADNGTILFDTDGDSPGDHFVRLVRTNPGQAAQALHIAFRGWPAQSRMSPDGKWAVFKVFSSSGYQIWHDDGTDRGTMFDLNERLWTDEEIAFSPFFQLINDGCVMPVQLISEPGEPRTFALLVPTCRADVNADGILSEQDLKAWIDAFIFRSNRADQNADGRISSLDFTAWISNYNTGCDLP